jgi:hypothetical protein
MLISVETKGTLSTIGRVKIITPAIINMGKGIEANLELSIFGIIFSPASLKLHHKIPLISSLIQVKYLLRNY